MQSLNCQALGKLCAIFLSRVIRDPFLAFADLDEKKKKKKEKKGEITSGLTSEKTTSKSDDWHKEILRHDLCLQAPRCGGTECKIQI